MSESLKLKPNKTKQMNTKNELTVFGSKPKNAIFLPPEPLGVRANCKSGQWTIGSDDFKGNSLEMSIIKCSKMYGKIGMTEEFWTQIFFIPAPTCKALPSSTVCVTYLKTRSRTQFEETLIQLMENGEPGLGIFKGFFRKHEMTTPLGQKSEYYSVFWEWRERQSKEENEQLGLLCNWLPGVNLVDTSKSLDCVDGMDQETIDMLKQRNKDIKSLNGAF